MLHPIIGPFIFRLWSTYILNVTLSDSIFKVHISLQELQAIVLILCRMTFHLSSMIVDLHFDSDQQYRKSTNCCTDCIFWQFAPNLPCLYRNFLCVWCHLWSYPGRRECVLIEQPPIVQFCLPCWVTCPLFFEWSDWSNQVRWPNSFARQFPPLLCSLGGIFYAKKIILD